MSKKVNKYFEQRCPKCGYVWCTKSIKQRICCPNDKYFFQNPYYQKELEEWWNRLKDKYDNLMDRLKKIYRLHMDVDITDIYEYNRTENSLKNLEKLLQDDEVKIKDLEGE